MKFAYRVQETWDGCSWSTLYEGGREQCLAFIRKNWSRFHMGKGTLDLVNNQTGRCESFVL